MVVSSLEDVESESCRYVELSLEVDEAVGREGEVLKSGEGEGFGDRGRV